MTKPKSELKAAGKSFAEFKAAHDKGTIVPAKIKIALEKLGDGWLYQLEFLKLAGLSTTDLSNYCDLFAEHFVLIDKSKKVWFGSKTKAEQARKLVP